MSRGVFWFFVVVMILLVGGSMFFLYIRFAARSVSSEANVSVGRVYLRAFSNATPVSAHYSFVSDDFYRNVVVVEGGKKRVVERVFNSGFKKEGILSSTTFEVVDGVFSNETYSFVAWGDGFYAGMSKCFLSMNKCYVYLDAVGTLSFRVHKIEDKYFVQISVRGGVLRNPIVCESHSANVLRVRAFNMNDDLLSRADIPERLSNSVDGCWLLGKDRFSGVNDYYFVVDDYGLDEKDFVRLWLVDACSYGGSLSLSYDDCGAEDSYFYLFGG